MVWRRVSALILGLWLAGCGGIAAVGPERVTVGKGFSVAGAMGWNRLPPDALGADAAWTRDGPGLDLVLFVAGRGEGEPLLHHRRERKALLLHAFSTPTEIAELWETELALRGYRAVRTSRLEPVAFAGQPGFRFRYSFADAAGLVSDGLAAGRVAEGRVYLIAFQGTRAHSFGAHLPAVRRLLASVRLAPPG